MDAIILRGVQTHNLKNIDLILPHGKLYVVTGVSGSGKSSLAFDTLYAEGQRRYVESLSAYARQFLARMEKPDVEFMSGIAPAIAIEAKNVVTNARSTVGTQTEINDYLRLLFSRIGKTICPDCQKPVVKNRPDTVYVALEENHQDEGAWILFPVTLGEQSQKYKKEVLEELERQGFYDFYFDGKLLTAEEWKEVCPKSVPQLWVCQDRLRVSSQKKKRILDSLEAAFQKGRGYVRVVVGGQEYDFSEGFSCSSCSKNFKEPAPNLFSFNSPLGACPECQGFGRVITLDWNLVIPDENKSLYEGAIEPWTKPSSTWDFQQLLKFCRRKKIPLHKSWKKLSKKHRDWVLNGVKGDNYHSVQDFFNYLERKTYKMHVRIFLSKYRGFVPCEACQESRLKPEALYVQVQSKNIYELQQLSLDALNDFLEALDIADDVHERVEPVYLELKKRTRFLKEVGLGYLTLSRLSRTLSGGEVQRIHLATSLGSSLVDTLYVLDEPSIGLHERDNELLIRLLKELRDLGNTVVVVEHDRMMIEAADEVLDLGPAGGERGGQLLFQGSIKELQKSKKSVTGDYLAGRKTIERIHLPESKQNQWIKLKGVRQHNLKNIDVDIPLNQLVVLSGVSGSGKSTLLYEILYRHYQRYRGRPIQDLGEVQGIKGFDQIDEMMLVDQTPIGRSPRSNPVTYIKAFDEIRKIFASTDDARRHGHTAGAFSFNVDGGRCDACKGDGRIKVEMHFLADVYVECEACHGKRFKKEILEIQYQGKNIDGVLNMTVDQALNFFEGQKRASQKLSLLSQVGLGYLKLGQSATTLSGGEAQRLKLAMELYERRSNHILYLFDEPTTGLHYHDIQYLMKAFDEILSRGHSIVVIEHNMEIIKSADYIIDLGPEGGSQGGEVLYQGNLEGIERHKQSFTGTFLKAYRKPIFQTA